MPAPSATMRRLTYNVIIDLTDPRPGTLGDRVRQLDEPKRPRAGSLGHRLRLADPQSTVE